MNPFDVDWPTAILYDLADIYLNSADRNAVTSAQAEIDRLLRANSLGNGTYVAEDLYQLRVAPLTVTYEIQVANHRVEIYSIHYTP